MINPIKSNVAFVYLQGRKKGKNKGGKRRKGRERMKMCNLITNHVRKTGISHKNETHTSKPACHEYGVFFIGRLLICLK